MQNINLQLFTNNKSHNFIYYSAIDKEESRESNEQEERIKFQKIDKDIDNLQAQNEINGLQHETRGVIRKIWRPKLTIANQYKKFSQNRKEEAEFWKDGIEHNEEKYRKILDNRQRRRNRNFFHKYIWGKTVGKAHDTLTKIKKWDENVFPKLMMLMNQFLHNKTKDSFSKTVKAYLNKIQEYNKEESELNSYLIENIKDIKLDQDTKINEGYGSFSTVNIKDNDINIVYEYKNTNVNDNELKINKKQLFDDLKKEGVDYCITKHFHNDEDLFFGLLSTLVDKVDDKEIKSELKSTLKTLKKGSDIGRSKFAKNTEKMINKNIMYSDIKRGFLQYKMDKKLKEDFELKKDGDIVLNQEENNSILSHTFFIVLHRFFQKAPFKDNKLSIENFQEFIKDTNNLDVIEKLNNSIKNNNDNISTNLYLLETNLMKFAEEQKKAKESKEEKTNKEESKTNIFKNNITEIKTNKTEIEKIKSEPKKISKNPNFKKLDTYNKNQMKEINDYDFITDDYLKSYKDLLENTEYTAPMHRRKEIAFKVLQKWAKENNDLDEKINNKNEVQKAYKVAEKLLENNKTGNTQENTKLDTAA